MRFFDAHCDTVMRIRDGDLDFVAGRGRAHMDLPRLLAAGSRVQLFAVFAARSYFSGQDLRTYAEQAIADIRGWAAASGGRLQFATSADDIGAAFAASGEGSVHALIGLEGADPLEGRAEALEHFYRLGVRNVIPAWDDNLFSGSSAGPGDPLTAEGIKLIELCGALRVMVDVSHSSDAAFRQICDIVRGPFIASHSNCRSLCPVARNLTDDMIRTLADRGGVMGINLSPDFLDPAYLAAWNAALPPLTGADAATRQRLREAAGPALRAIPLPGMDWIARHVRHAIDVGGEDCVGLGGDLDGIIFMPAGVTGIESYPAIAESLVSAGLSPAQVEKVCWRNMARVFMDVLG